MKVCPGPISGRKPGSPCGRPVRAYVAPGHGRCAYHATALERLVVNAILRAERELRELRALPPEDEQTHHGEETRRDEDAKTWLPSGWIEIDERTTARERRHQPPPCDEVPSMDQKAPK